MLTSSSFKHTHIHKRQLVSTIYEVRDSESNTQIAHIKPYIIFGFRAGNSIIYTAINVLVHCETSLINKLENCRYNISQVYS